MPNWLRRSRACAALCSLIFILVQNADAAVLDLVRQIREGAGSRVIATNAAEVGAVKLERRWRDKVCEYRLKNSGAAPVKIQEVVLADVAHGLSGDTPVYAEGFQMLS